MINDLKGKTSVLFSVTLSILLISVAVLAASRVPSVSAQIEIVVDNPAAAFVGTWPTSTSVAGYYGSNYQYNNAGVGADTATWSFNIPIAGQWRVDARWTQGPNRATDAPYTVNYAGGSTTIDRNQQANGASWQVLGTFNFNVGTYSVRLTDNANNIVIADAIRIVQIPGPAAPSCAVYERIYASWYSIPVSTWVTMTSITLPNMPTAGYYKVELDANIYEVNSEFGLSIGVDAPSGDATTSHYYDEGEGGDAVLGVHTQETYYLAAGVHTFYFRAGHTNALGTCQIQNSHITVTFFSTGRIG